MMVKPFFRAGFITALCSVCAIALQSQLLAETKQYLLIGHPRDDGPGEIVQRHVERLEYSAFDLLLLGGDYTWRGTGTRETVAYLDAVFDLSAPGTLAALGNHDTSKKVYFTDVTGRSTYYSLVTNGVTFVVLDTTNDSQNIVGEELQMLSDTINALPANEHLVVVHHHLIWLSGYAPLAHLKGSPLIGASSANLSGLNFYDDVYPLLVTAKNKGGDVLCLAGDRTGTETEEFFIDHTTVDGVRFIGAGLKEELTPTLRTVVVLHHDLETGTLVPEFKHLSDLARVPDEPMVINEVHYNPSPEDGAGHAFIELLNRGVEPYEVSGAGFVTGINYNFPDGTIIAPGEFVLLAVDPALHEASGVRVFPITLNPVILENEPIWLRDASGLEMDHVQIGVGESWPTTPNGQGPSLMLIDPAFDNGPASNWAASDQSGGTPGRSNIQPPTPGPLDLGGEAATMVWKGVVTGGRYQLEYTSSLDFIDWQPAGPIVTATGVTLEQMDLDASLTGNRFYRLGRQFP